MHGTATLLQCCSSVVTLECRSLLLWRCASVATLKVRELAATALRLCGLSALLQPAAAGARGPAQALASQSH